MTDAPQDAERLAEIRAWALRNYPGEENAYDALDFLLRLLASLEREAKHAEETIDDLERDGLMAAAEHDRLTAARDEAGDVAKQVTGLLFQATDLIKELCVRVGIDTTPMEPLLIQARTIVAKWTAPASPERTP